jgi:hypothetical protein
VRVGLVARNVAEMVDAPRIPHRKMAILTEEQARLLEETARDGRHEALYVLALSTSTGWGCRCVRHCSLSKVSISSLSPSRNVVAAGSLCRRRRLRRCAGIMRGKRRNASSLGRRGQTWIWSLPIL